MKSRITKVIVIILVSYNIITILASDMPSIEISNALPVQGEELNIKVSTDTVKLGRAYHFTIRNAKNKIVFNMNVDAQSAIKGAIFTPVSNGFFDICLDEMAGEEIISTQHLNLPVLACKLNIIYWDCPRSIRFLSARKAKEAEKKYWQSRGVMPLAWVPGIHEKKWSDLNFYQRWLLPFKQNYPGIMIDEFSPTEGSKTVIVNMDAALKKLKAEHPASYVAAWVINTIGDNNQELLNALIWADTILIERYLSGSPSYYYGFNTVWEQIRKHKLAYKSIFALGIGNKWINTKKELANQVRYVKKTAPEATGIAFFGSDPRDFLYEKADELCLEYYVKPVISLVIEASNRILLYNCGGMDCESIQYSFSLNGSKTTGTTKLLKAGEKVLLNLDKNVKDIKVIPSSAYTILN